MANLSQEKRQKLLGFLDTLRQEHANDDEALIAISEIENELEDKKYGLVWEKHEETVDVQMHDNIPVFTEYTDKEIEAAPGENYNFLLEGDNLHSLRLLEKTHLGKVDLIYIDPPYNTKNKDFIYDDKRIDETDGFQHSKWLSFMSERLKIANKLLKKTGVMAISIGYQEVNDLVLLCQELFASKNTVCVTVQTSSGNAVQNGFTYVQEYIVFVTPTNFTPFELESEQKEYSSPYHGMTLSGFNQSQRPNQTYPIYIDNSGMIIGCGKTLQERIDSGTYTGDKADFIFDYSEAPEGCYTIWPLTKHGDPCVWRLIPERLMKDWKSGYIKVIPNTKGKNKFTIQYLSGGVIDKIEKGTVKTYQSSPDVPTLEVEGYKTSASSIPTIWSNNKFLTSAGSRDIKDIFGEKVDFSFPKPVNLIKEIIMRVAPDDALVLDFFAGSGTTAQAVMELNSEGAHRRFILCTNNENNICNDITYPRLKTVITGRRPNGTIFSDGCPSNLKYFRTDFISKDTENITQELLEHVSEMVELENGIKLDGNHYLLILSDDEADDLEIHWSDYPSLRALYISRDVLLTSTQRSLFNKVNIYTIPDYYFKFEMQEVGEAW